MSHGGSSAQIGCAFTFYGGKKIMKIALTTTGLFTAALVATSTLGGTTPISAAGTTRRVTATVDTVTLVVSDPIVEIKVEQTDTWATAPIDSAESEFRMEIEEPLRVIIEVATAMLVFDCNGNTIPDATEIAGGATDADGDLVLDSCEYAIGDLNLNGVIDSADTSILLGWWGIASPVYGDLNGDNVVDAMDLGIILGRFGVPVY
jgi:hypothetical protein